MDNVQLQKSFIDLSSLSRYTSVIEVTEKKTDVMLNSGGSSHPI
jgi:hypothetical protein